MTEARIAYHQRINTINAQISLICLLIQEHGVGRERTWGACGDLGHVSEVLQEIIDFLPAHVPTEADVELIERAWNEAHDEARRNREMVRGI